MGFELDGQALNTAFKRFKEIADRKKHVTAMDLEALVTDELREEIPGYHARVVRGRGLLAAPAARARVGDAARTAPRRGHRSPATARSTRSSRRSTPPRASRAKLSDFTIGAVTEGQDALGEVSVVVEVDGFTGAGQGVSTDIIDAAARAYVRALSVAVARSRADDASACRETAA